MTHVFALLRLQMERMRLGLQKARQRQLRAVVAAVDRATASRLRAAEAKLERAWCRNAELEERLRQMTAEGQACLGVARSQEAVAAGIRATLDQMLLLQLQQPAHTSVGDAEDAQSCCFETAATATYGGKALQQLTESGRRIEADRPADGGRLRQIRR